MRLKDLIRKLLVNVSYYDMTIDELLKKRKREHENTWVYLVNTVVASVFSTYFFYIGLQHLSIIAIIAASIVGMTVLNNILVMQHIDQAIFLIKVTEAGKNGK